MLIGPNALKPGTAAHIERMKRIHAFLAGQLRPASLLDVDYKGVQRGSIAEESLMWFLRLITHADPMVGTLGGNVSGV